MTLFDQFRRAPRAQLSLTKVGDLDQSDLSTLEVKRRFLERLCAVIQRRYQSGKKPRANTTSTTTRKCACATCAASAWYEARRCTYAEIFYDQVSAQTKADQKNSGHSLCTKDCPIDENFGSDVRLRERESPFSTTRSH